MSKMKLIAGGLLVLAVLFAQVGSVFAAPTLQGTTPITGTVTNIQTQTDTNGMTTVLVTLDNMGQTQTVRISLADAVTLGLVTVDSVTNAVTVVDQTGKPPLTIDSAMVIPDQAENINPVAALLASFFGKDAGEVNQLHLNGFGFGVIAQALWMEKNLDGSISAQDILQAKKDNDFSAFTVQLPDGTSYTPTNWGQFKKAVLEKKNNLGMIVSGHATNDGTETGSGFLQSNGHGYGKDNNPGKGNGNGNGHNKNP